jgi:hypothetical protein
MFDLTVMMRLKLVVRFMTETNTIFNDKVHDEERNENDARTNTDDDDIINTDDDDITKGYNERE